VQSQQLLKNGFDVAQEPSGAVFQNSAEGNNSDTSESVAFSRIQKKSTKIGKIWPK
jgi:hypothetical protein